MNKNQKIQNHTKKKTMISMRIPDEMIEQLREIAQEKGDLGYQQLIKNYIQSGLQGEPSLTDGKSPLTQINNRKDPQNIQSSNDQRTLEINPLTKFDPPKTALKPRKKKATSFTDSKIIAEDIQNLAGNIKDLYSFFEGKTFLITGAFGFLGRYLVFLLKYLNEEILEKKASALLLDNFVTGYEQRVLSDENLHFYRHDVVKPFSTDQPMDYIIHAAGIASPVYYTKYPIETMDVGTIGTRNALELARSKNVSSFLFTSSSEVYGDPDAKHVPTKETYNGNVSILGSRSCYDESKRFGETMCVTYWKVFNTPVKIVRPFNVYGPGIRPDDYRVLPNFIEHALRKEPLPIHGPGHNTRSFCYINDAIEALLRVLFSDANGEAFNIGNPGPEISVKDLASMVAEFMPHQVDVVHIDPPHAVYASADPKRRCPDISKIQSVTDYEPRYSLEEGLVRTIKWFQES
ncbi:MAG: NAD-dependent epimerase/dehydratase family protein [Candidatus Omnitrophica bacterium]|nr:NAD-dependent epimerase/dehydratase family protein [Candidatus Omnitrophota bacterium]